MDLIAEAKEMVAKGRGGTKVGYLLVKAKKGSKSSGMQLTTWT